MYNLSDFKNQSAVNIVYPKDLRSSVEKVALLWQQLCDLPAESKQSIPYSNNDIGIGYEYKDGSGNKGDYKENFDVSLTGLSWLLDRAATVHDQAAQQFIVESAHLAALIKPLALEFAHDLEDGLGLPGLAAEIDDASFFVRFIHYFGDRSLGQETATAHIDRGGFTLHLFETDPGLERLGFNRQWLPLPVSAGETVIIPGIQMQYRSGGTIKALCHRVAANEKTAATGRYSAVCFVVLNRTPHYNKERFGRLQEQVPGFNYELSPAALADIFQK